MSRDFMDEALTDVLPDDAVENDYVRHPDKLKKSTLFQRTSEVMRGVPMIGPGRTLWPRFKKVFHVKKSIAGEHIFLEETDDQVLRYVSQQKIIDSILEYWERKTAWVYKAKEVSIAEKTAKECMKYWAAISPSLDIEIQPVLEKDFPGYCYHRLGFNFERGEYDWKEKCPAFSELFGRTSNYLAFMAWIGSLFDAKSSRQQYVWLYGDGRNGKSTIGRILARLMGPAVRFEQVPKNDKFWTSGLLGKRLIVFGDCNNSKYVMDGAFKALTGEDHVRIEEKGRPSYSTAMTCKFLFFSNEKPDVNGGESNKRRAIFCEVGAVTQEFGKDYEEVLWLEIPFFVGECRKIYLDMTKDTKIITTDDKVMEDLLAYNEERFEVFVEKCLNVTGDTIPPENMCTPFQMADCFNIMGITNHFEQSNYKNYLARTYGIKIKQVTISGRRTRVYWGCAQRSTPKL